MFRLPVARAVVLLLISEACLILAAYVAALSTDTSIDASVYLNYEDGWLQVSIVSAVVLLSMYFMDLYSRFARRSKIETARSIMHAFGIAFLVQALLSYVWAPASLPSNVMIAGSLIAIPAVLIWRFVYTGYLLATVGAESVLFAGTSPAVQEIASEVVSRPELGLRIIGYVSDSPSASMPSSAPYLGPLTSLKNSVVEERPDRVIVGFADRRGQLPIYDLLDLRFAGFVIQEAATMFEATCSRLSVASLRPSDLIFSGRFHPKRRSEIIHGITDILVAGIATILLLPVVFVVALAVKLTSPGPLFYRQSRIGLNGKPFYMLKFRTMYEPKDRKGPKRPWDADAEPQVTRVGHILRKLRINEMPQLFNVLRREMSVVGPRPERPEYVEVFMKEIPFYGHRHSVRPGITGWAQINYGHADTIEDTIRKLEYDLYYIKNMSNALDLYIMFHTAKTVLLAQDSG